MLLSTGAYPELFSLIPNLKVNHLRSREVDKTVQQNSCSEC